MKKSIKILVIALSIFTIFLSIGFTVGSAVKNANAENIGATAI